MFTLNFLKQFPAHTQKNGAKNAIGEKEASFPYYIHD